MIWELVPSIIRTKTSTFQPDAEEMNNNMFMFVYIIGWYVNWIVLMLLTHVTVNVHLPNVDISTK